MFRSRITQAGGWEKRERERDFESESNQVNPATLTLKADSVLLKKEKKRKRQKTRAETNQTRHGSPPGGGESHWLIMGKFLGIWVEKTWAIVYFFFLPPQMEVQIAPLLKI